MATTALAITPNFDKKTAKFKGAIAAGEHVAVTIQNDGEYVASTTNLRLRVVDPVCGKTLAIFPQPVEEGETPETWDSDLTPLSCELNLNTDRMLKAVPPAATVPLLFVLDDKEADTLFFKDMCEVTHWPMVRGEDEPYNLDDYPDIIEDFKDRLADAESDIADAVSDIAQAVESVNTAIDGIDGKVSAAVSSAVPEAVAGKADKVADATAGNLAALNSGGNIVDSGKKPSDFAPVSHSNNTDIHVTAEQKTAWSAKQDAISDLSDIRSKANSAYQVPDGGIPKSALHAEVQESLGKADSTASEILGCINAAEFDSDSKKIVFKHGTTVVAEIDATAFVKDGMVSSVEIVDDNLVITFNTDAGLDPISIPLTDIFDPGNYYTKTAANNKFKTRQTPVQSPPTELTTTNAFIDTISQNANGVITPTKRGVATVAPASATDSGQVADALAVKNALAGKASAADATLTQHYTDWVCEPAETQSEDPYFVAWDLIPETDIYAWCLFTGFPEDRDFVNVGSEDENATEFSVEGLSGETVVATRTASGYDLGDQTDKPLASEAEAVALRTGKANDNAVVKLTGDQDIYGIKTFNGNMMAASINARGSVSANGITIKTDFNLNFLGSGNILMDGGSILVRGGFAVFSRTDGTQSPQFIILELDDEGASIGQYSILLPFASGTLALTAGTGHAGNLAALDANGNPTDAGYHFEVRNGIPCIVQYT